MIIEEGSVFAGRYRLERALARGGMGSVWVAQHTQLDVQLAVKFMDPTFAASGDARARFEREAKAAAKLQSPNVVQVHDYGVEDGTPYIVMELLVGEDLGDRLKRERRLSLRATAEIVTQVAKALRRAHEEKIVHRDLKPGNIFLARNQDDVIIKVLDFGIAKARMSTDGEVTKTGTLIGSPHYMSPEQARGGKNLDHRSDLWSLAVIMFRAVTGHLPFPGDEIGEVILAICADPIPTPSQLAPDLSPAVDAFFERALARDPAERFQSAREMAEAFAAVSAGGPLVASGASVPPTRPPVVETGPEIPRPPSLPGDLSSRPAPFGADSSPRIEPTAATVATLSDPMSRSGPLSPAGSTIDGIPGVSTGNRSATIAVAIVAGIAVLGGVGVFMSRGSASGPPRPTPTATPTSAPTISQPPPITPPPLPPPVAVTAQPSASATAAPSETASAHPQPRAVPGPGPRAAQEEGARRREAPDQQPAARVLMCHDGPWRAPNPYLLTQLGAPPIRRAEERIDGGSWELGAAPSGAAHRRRELVPAPRRERSIVDGSLGAQLGAAPRGAPIVDGGAAELGEVAVGAVEDGGGFELVRRGGGSGGGRGLRARVERRRRAPDDGDPPALDAGRDLEARERRDVGHDEAAPEGDRAALRLSVDAQRVCVEREHLALGHPGPPEAVDAREPLDPRQAHPHHLERGVQPLEHHPLVSLEVGDALVEGRGLEVAEVEAVRDLGEGGLDVLARGGAEEPLARGPEPPDGRKRGGRPGVRRVDDLRLAGARCRPDAQRVLLAIEAPPRVLVGERDPLETGGVLHQEALVEDHPIAGLDRQPHRQGADGPAGTGVGVAGEQHVGAREVRRQIAGEPDAAPRVLPVVDLGCEDRVRIEAGHERLVRETERRLGDGGDVKPAQRPPRDRCRRRAMHRGHCDGRRRAPGHLHRLSRSARPVQESHGITRDNGGGDAPRSVYPARPHPGRRPSAYPGALRPV